MTKILLACDMEGITGVTRWEHVDPNHSEYQRYRRLMTRDVNAVIEGAFAGGATEIQVADGHSRGQNILIEELDQRAVLNCGTSSPWSMMNGIDASFDGVIFVGYHAMAGTANAILAHTWSTEILGWELNGKAFGEFSMNAMIAGSFGVPAIMASGDQTFAMEATNFVPGIETVIVKHASGYFSGNCLAPEKTRAMLVTGAKNAVAGVLAGKAPEALKMDFPADVAVSFIQPHMAESASRLLGSERTAGRTVTFRVNDVATAFSAARTLSNSGS